MNWRGLPRQGARHIVAPDVAAAVQSRILMPATIAEVITIV